MKDQTKPNICYQYMTTIRTLNAIINVNHKGKLTCPGGTTGLHYLDVFAVSCAKPNTFKPSSKNRLGHMDIKRAAGYFLGTMCEISEFHVDLEREGALPAIINLATMEDIECQEYAAFCLAHLSSNKDYQVKLVNNLGVVRPLVAMLSSDAEPKHYAGLALLKLADNFENHLKIAEEGGSQALLRWGRTRSTDEQLQYKAALTVGQLASNAVKLLPQKERAGMAGVPGVTDKAIGHGVRVLGKLREQANNTQKGKDITTNYLDKSLKQSKQQMDDDEALRRSETSARKGRGNGSDQIGDLVTKTALKIGVDKDK